MKTVNISVQAVVFTLTATGSAADSEGFKTCPKIVDFGFVQDQASVPC